jgi:ABC-type branched-subunit amino acid transport system ATPase component/ABC-type branched-subunit amino acid transport system permease subunit
MTRHLGYLLAIGLIVLFPFVAPNTFYLHLGQIFAYTAIAVIGLNLLLGLSGQMSLGHGGFYALGAYGSALLATAFGWPIGFSILGGVALAVGFGLLVGLICLRTRGLYLAMATLAFGFMVEIAAQRWTSVTGGAMGLFGIPQLDFGDFRMGPTYFFWVTAALLMCVQISSDYIFSSRYGRRLQAIKESESFARTIGLNVPLWRTAIFMVSAGLAGLGGALFAHQSGFISSEAFSIRLTIGLLIATVIGGLGRSYGPILGAAILIAIAETIAALHEIGYLLYGGILLMVTILFPEGAIGLLNKLIPGRKAKETTESRAKTRSGGELEIATVAGAQLKISGVSKSYAGVLALAELDMDIAPGSVHALIGPNGAGKSTFINVVAGLYRADSGAISLDGENVIAMNAHERARLGLARTFQNLQLIQGVSVVDNVMLGLSPAQAPPTDFVHWLVGRKHELRERSEAMAILDYLGIGHLAELRPKDLAYGHRKLVELARAIAQKPRIMLLDEPVAGLNPQEAEAIAKVIARLRERGVTILLVEHNMDFVMSISDRITVLDFGHCIAEGTPVEIQGNPDVIKAYLGTDEAVA